MIKLLLTGIWGVLLLSGSVYFFHSNGKADATNVANDAKPYFGKLETIFLDTMSVVYIGKNAVQGYVILDVAFIVDAAKNSKLTVPSKLILQNAVNNTFLQTDDLNINRLDKFDVDALQLKLAEEANERIGDTIVSEVMIQRIDFLTSQEVRDRKLRGG